MEFLFCSDYFAYKEDFVKLIPTDEVEIKLMQAWQKCSQSGTVSCSVLRQNSNWLHYFKNLYLCSAFGLNVLLFTEKCRLSTSVVSFYFLLHLIDFKLGRKDKV